MEIYYNHCTLALCLFHKLLYNVPPAISDANINAVDTALLLTVCMQMYVAIVISRPIKYRTVYQLNQYIAMTVLIPFIWHQAVSRVLRVLPPPPSTSPFPGHSTSSEYVSLPLNRRLVPDITRWSQNIDVQLYTKWFHLIRLSGKTR